MYSSQRESNWNLTLESFLTKQEIKLLREELVRRRDTRPERRINWIEWFMIELGLNTGLRVFEITNLECKDLVLRGELSYVVVKKGKGDKIRHVRIGREFQSSIEKYLLWKQTSGEDTNPNSPLFLSNRSKGKYSTRGMQHAFKRCISYVNISSHHSIHHLRHTYASLLSISSKGDVRLVQRQLGHASLITTQIYIDLFEENVINAIENLI